MIRLLPRSTLFPYTTLFRSSVEHCLRSLPRSDRGEDKQCEIDRGMLWLNKLLFPKMPAPNCAMASTNLLIRDRKSTRLNSSHANISYAVFCLKKKNNKPD